MVLFGWKTHQLALPTSSGAHAFSTDADGHTPKAVTFEGSSGLSSGVIADGARYFWGAATDSKDLAFSVRSEDGSSGSASGRRRSGSDCIELINDTDNTNVGRASLTSFDVDEVNVNFSVAPDAAYLTNVTVYYGDLLDVALEDHVHSAVSGTETHITGLSFQPNLALVWACQVGFPGTPGSATNWIASHGIAIEEGGVITQGCFAGRDRSGATPHPAATIMHDNAIGAHIAISAAGVATFTGKVSLNSFNSDGVSVSPDAASMGYAQAYLLMNIGANKKALSFQDIETGTTGTGASDSAKEIVTGWKPNLLRSAFAAIPVT